MGIAAPVTPEEKAQAAAHDLGWEGAMEFAAGIVDKWTEAGHLLLHAGEMTAQELRTVQAVVRAIAAELRNP